MDITFGNKISVEEFHHFRKTVGWKPISDKHALNSINNAAFLVTAVVDNKTIGLTRVGSDGGYYIFITDVIVLPEYRNKGIAKQLMAKAMEFINEKYVGKGESVVVNLMAGKNLEPFYSQFGFLERPNEKFGAGMYQWIIK